MSEFLRNLLRGVALIGVIFTPRRYDDLSTLFRVDDLERIRQDVSQVGRDMSLAVEQVNDERTAEGKAA